MSLEKTVKCLQGLEMLSYYFGMWIEFVGNDV